MTTNCNPVQLCVPVLCVGVFAVLESVLIVYIGLLIMDLTHLITDSNNDQFRDDWKKVNTYTWLTLLHFGILTVFVVRERMQRFYASRPSAAMIIVSIIVILVSILVAFFGIPSLITRISIVPILAELGLSLIFTFVINDTVKMFTIRLH